MHKAANIVLFVAVDDTDVLGYIQLSDYENIGLNRVDARKFYAANGYEVRKEQTNLIKWWS
ncbi:hypothetical protein [Lentzea kentuckyensis]|uniref:hypothetical protein n=1 Tax=Lentzea kentuckyensis TaxID=360086 RepID=UPI000A3C2F39|nr:hypothetical protein [Lentzea kentuckyensis]